MKTTYRCQVYDEKIKTCRNNPASCPFPPDTLQGKCINGYVTLDWIQEITLRDSLKSNKVIKVHKGQFDQ